MIAPLPATTELMAGAAGNIAAVGVTEADSADQALLPTLLVVCTRQVYAVPFVRPVTTIGDALPLTDTLPQDAVYLTSVPDPKAPGLNDTVTAALPATTELMAGAAGNIAADGVTEADTADHALLPTLLVVCTRQV